jgi:regulator of nucleoside diphosphate kinase
MSGLNSGARAPDCIVLSSADFGRLEIMAYEETGSLRASILRKLMAGKIVDGAEMPANVATIGSVVRYRIGDGALERRTLSLPEASRPNGQFINILTPVGLALLGRGAGDTFLVSLQDGGELRVELADVEFQPEAEVRRRSLPFRPDDGPGAA